MESAHVTIGGSYRKHFPRIWQAVEEFRTHGATVLRPGTDQITVVLDDIVQLDGDPLDASAIEEAQLQAITCSELFYIVNPAGYVGPSAMAHAGYAHAKGVLIVCSELPFERTISTISAGVGTPEQALQLLIDRERGQNG